VAAINTYIFWTYLESELSDLQPLFEKYFEGLELRRDYEDSWEWLEGKTRNGNYELNISREHNWQQGIYENELTIIIKTNVNENEDFIANRLKNILQTSLYYGKRIYIKGTGYMYEIEKQY
jgi:hypothetical protein